jgi:dTDP-4-amino-4,6-dideoxygalactose transaminase
MYEIGKAEIEAVRKVIESGQLFRYRGGEGGWCDQFEQALAQKVGVSYAVSTSSGTGALMCALAGLEIGPGDEVIVPAYTFMASALAVLAVGAVPVLAEVDESLTIDPADVARRVTRYTKAIMPVHMLGLPCDMGALVKLAKRHNLAICEDACQAVGGSYRGKRLCSIGQVGAFSFNHYKNITCGEGGAVLTNSRDIFERALIYHDGGATFRSHAGEIQVPFFAGSNFRISEIQGAILFQQLKRLDGILARLRARRLAMQETLGESKLFRIAPDHCVEGNCGSNIILTFEGPQQAKAFVEQHKAACWMHRPIDSGRHVYSNWKPILEKRGSHHPKLNPFNFARRTIQYSPDMCPATLDILARTVAVSVPYAGTLAQAKAVARRMV